MSSATNVLLQTILSVWQRAFCRLECKRVLTLHGVERPLCQNVDLLRSRHTFNTKGEMLLYLLGLMLFQIPEYEMWDYFVHQNILCLLNFLFVYVIGFSFWRTLISYAVHINFWYFNQCTLSLWQGLKKLCGHVRK